MQKKFKELEKKFKESNRKIEKNEKKYSEINSKIENSYINIIQIISLVVAVLALILSNVLGYSALTENIKPSVLVGNLFIINGIALTGISFIIFMIQHLFFKVKEEKTPIGFILIPTCFYIAGFLILYYIK